MPTQCFRSLQGLALRVTRLDSCCTPVAGACSTVVSESFVTITLTAELEEADEFIVKLANGSLCISELGCATLKRYGVEVEICNADPDLFQIIAGVNPVLDYAGDTVGYEINEDLGGCGNFALEFWTRVPRDQCVDGIQQYIYWLLPCVTNGRVGDVTIENGPLTFSFNAEALPSTAWEEGPYNVVSTVAPAPPGNPYGTPGPLLEPISENTALHVEVTNVPPPVETCGCLALS